MKIKVDEEEIFELIPIRKQVICYDIMEDEVDEDLKRRVKYIISHKYERCMDRLKKEWIPKLQAKGEKSIPLDDDELAAFIFNQPDYKNRSARILEEKEKEPKV